MYVSPRHCRSTTRNLSSNASTYSCGRTVRRLESTTSARITPCRKRSTCRCGPGRAAPGSLPTFPRGPLAWRRAPARVRVTGLRVAGHLPAHLGSAVRQFGTLVLLLRHAQLHGPDLALRRLQSSCQYRRDSHQRVAFASGASPPMPAPRSWREDSSRRGRRCLRQFQPRQSGLAHGARLPGVRTVLGITVVEERIQAGDAVQHCALYARDHVALRGQQPRPGNQHTGLHALPGLGSRPALAAASSRGGGRALARRSAPGTIAAAQPAPSHSGLRVAEGEVRTR